MLSLGVHTTAWQFREHTLDGNQNIQTQTVPNQQVQIFVDKDYICPGYSASFYNWYTTNNLYFYADLQDNLLQDDEITLGPWWWYNSCDDILSERRDLNFWNTNNITLLNQTGQWDHVWQAEGHARQWQVRLSAMNEFGYGDYHVNGINPGGMNYNSTGFNDQWGWGGITHNTPAHNQERNTMENPGDGNMIKMIS